MRLTLPSASVVLFLLIQNTLGQQAVQTINLRPGWNAIHLEVHPESNQCEVVFAGVPVETVWGWNRRFSPVQFVGATPDGIVDLIPKSPDWLSYFPPEHPLRDQKTLYTVDGGKAYLIKLPASAVPVVLSVRGRPAIRRPDWVTDGFTLVGFGIDRTNPPTLAKFFGPSPAQAGQKIFRLNALGVWQEVSTPTISRMTNGEAMFIRSKGPSDYIGHLQLILPQVDRLDFGAILQEQTIEVRNAGTNPVNLVVRTLPSVDPNQVGPLPLDYWFAKTNGGFHFGWTNFNTSLVQSNVAPGRSWRLRIAVRRRDFAAATTNPQGTSLQTLLEVTEQSGSSRWVIPVSAERSLSSGLWAGSVAINKVSQPAVSVEPVPTSSSLQFRLIVHVDRQGNTRLLQKVLQMWQDGTTKPDPQNPDLQVVDVPGRYVLLTDEGLASAYKGSTLRDGRPAGRRMSSAAFGFRDKVFMAGSGDFSAPFAWRECTVNLDYNDPVNPFKHAFHPDHDNLNDDYTAGLVDGKESFSVSRTIRIEFSGQDPDGLPLAGWGADQAGGIYRESIVGLHKHALNIQGTFRLRRVSSVDTVIDPP